jgi:hypothetical protein
LVTKKLTRETYDGDRQRYKNPGFPAWIPK